MLMQHQAYPSAQAICEKLLARRPDDFNARHLLGLIQLQAGHPDAAREQLARASRLPVAPRYRAQALSNLSLALGQLNRPQQALDAIEQAIALQREELAFHLNRLNLLEQLERWPDILQAAEDCPRLHQLEDARYPLVKAERVLGHYRQALARLEPLAEEDPPELFGEYCLLRMALGDRQSIQRQLAEGSVEQLAYAADYLAEQGAREDALLLYRQLLQRDPRHPGARHLIDAAEGRLSAAAPAAYISALYDTHAAQFEQHLVGRLGYRAPQLLVEMLAEALPSPLNSVADLGCGSGLTGQALRARLSINELAGCDLSAAMLEQAGRKGVYDRLERAELLHWLQEQASFDLICATDVLIYIGDLGPLLNQVARRLTPQGHFAFTLEQCAHDLEITPSGRYRHSENHIRQRCTAAGLELVHCRSFPLRLEEGGQLSGLMVLCRRRCTDPGVPHE